MVSQVEWQCKHCQCWFQGEVRFFCSGACTLFGKDKLEEDEQPVTRQVVTRPADEVLTDWTVVRRRDVVRTITEYQCVCCGNWSPKRPYCGERCRERAKQIRRANPNAWLPFARRLKAKEPSDPEGSEGS